MQSSLSALSNTVHFAGKCATDAWRALAGSKTKFGVRQTLDDELHLNAAMRWLRQSIGATGSQGSSHSFIIFRGWRAAYPETTGYILKTFLRFAEREENSANIEISRQLADWLLTTQLPDGGIPGLDLARSEGANVFNTGMVLLGWNAIYLRLGDEKYLAAGRAAGDFLLRSVDDAGCFSRHTSYRLVHSYNVRAAWALLELGQISGDRVYVKAAERNIHWTLRQQLPNGFFENNIFVPGGNALTHSIGYVLSGLLESYLLTKEEAYLEAVLRTAEELLTVYARRMRIVAELGQEFEEKSSHICIVGYCQLAIVFMQLYLLLGDKRYLKNAVSLIEDAKATQSLGSREQPWYGGIPGSFPIYGRYARLQYPNWAAKFFADALLLKMQIAEGRKVKGISC